MTGGVRTIEAAELADWLRCTGVGFFVDFAEGYADYFRDEVDLARTWGGVDDGHVVGTLRSFPTHLTVPGPATMEAAALTNVTVAPTHRRRGLLTEMITADLRASAERGEPVGILIASEYPIYGRFGYGAAAHLASYSVDTRATRFRRAPVGRVELVDRATLRHEAPALYDRFHAHQPGSIDRSPRWWDRVLHQVEVPGAEAPKGYGALYRSAHDEPEGYVRYQAKQRWDDMRPNGLLTVDEMLATTSDAYEALWQFCCQVDLVSCVEAGNRSVDEALPWLLEDARTVRQTGRFDFLWVRILDVPGGVDGPAVRGRGAARDRGRRPARAGRRSLRTRHRTRRCFVHRQHAERRAHRAGGLARLAAARGGARRHLARRRAHRRAPARRADPGRGGVPQRAHAVVLHLVLTACARAPASPGPAHRGRVGAYGPARPSSSVTPWSRPAV